MNVPPGFRVMPEEERLATLEELRQKLADLSLRYDKLPLRIETEGQIRQQRWLIDKIKEAENAAKVMSRSRVVVEV